MSHDSPMLWQAPECARAVEYSPVLLEEIRRHALEAFFAVPRGGAETGGVLYGRHGERRVRILAWRPLECEHLSGPSFVLSPGDHERLARLIAAPGTDPALEGLAPIGWYHSHTRSGIFLSAADLEIHARHFPEPWQIALVLRPGVLETRAGFFVRDAGGVLKTEASYREFEVAPLAIPEAPAPAAPEPEPETEPKPATLLELPRFLTAAPPPRARIRGAWWLVPVLVAVGAGGFFAWDRWAPAGNPSPVWITVTDRAGQLEVRWNPEEGAVRDALSAKLQLEDGALHSVGELAPAQLRGGLFAYAPQSAQVEVRLTIERPGGKRAEGAATFRGQPPPVHELRQRNELLEKELLQARTEMINQAIQIHSLRATVNNLKAAAKRRP